MAIAFVQTGSEGRTTGTGTAVSNLTTNPVSGNVLVAYIATWKATATLITSLADNKSNTWTKQASVLGANGAGCEIWTTTVSATGASFSVTATATTAFDMNIRVVEYSGVSATLDKTATNNRQSPGTTLVVTSPTLTSANELICAVVSAGTTGLTAATSGYTNRGLQASGASIQAYSADDKIVAATTAVTSNYTFSAIGGGAEVVGLIATFAQAAGGTIYNNSVSETASAADTVSTLQTFTNALSETGSAADTVTGRIVMAGTLAEAGTAADAVSTLATMLGALTEAAAASDAVSASMVMTVTVTETASALDTLAGLLTMAASIAEAASAADTTTGGSLYSASISETASAADTVAAALAMAASVSEAGTALETLTGLINTAAILLSESGFATDTITALINTVTTAVAEVAAAADTVTGGSVYTNSVSETATAADSLTAALTLVTSMAESAAALDSLTAAYVFVGTVSESAAAIDGLATTAITNITISETANASDTTGGTVPGAGGQPTFSVGGDSVTDLYPSADITYPNGVTRQTGHT